MVGKFREGSGGGAKTFRKLFPFLKGTQRFFASFAANLLSPTLLTKLGINGDSKKYPEGRLHL